MGSRIPALAFPSFISVATSVVASLAGCVAWGGRPSSRLSSRFHEAQIRTIAVVIDAGDQSRVPAEQVMNTLRLMLLQRGYRPVLLPSLAAPSQAAMVAGADALLSVVLTFQWQTVMQTRGRPLYDHTVDLARISIAATMRRTSDGRVLLNGKFVQGGIDLMTGKLPEVIEDEWSTVVRGLSATLSALPPGLAFAPGGARVRHLSVTLAPDEDYRRARGWERQASDRITGASHILEVEFGLRLELKDTQSWVSADQPHTLAEHLASMRRQVPGDSTDIVLGMTGQAAFKPDSSRVVGYGVSEPFGRTVLVRQSGPTTDIPLLADILESATIAREVAHLFGALGPDDPRSGDVLGFDDRTRRILVLTRERSFDAGELRNVNTDSLRQIYRTAGSEGAAMLTILEARLVREE